MGGGVLIERTVGLRFGVQMAVSSISSCRRKVRTLYFYPAFCVFPEMSCIPGELFIE